MRSASSEPPLYVVCECPVGCGMMGVLALKIVSSGKLVFFAPCCGLAWREPPLHGRVDETNAMETVEPGPLVLPSLDDLRKANLVVIRTEPLADWHLDMPATLAWA
jgi:hypothetical protein